RFPCSVVAGAAPRSWARTPVRLTHPKEGARFEPLPLDTLWRAIPRRMNAGRPVASLYLPQLRYHLLTLCGSHPAARMEHASSWRIQRAGDLSRERYALSLSVYYRVGYGYGGKERLGIWVERGRIDRVPVGDLHDAAQVHHRHPVADVPYHRQ